MAQSVGRRTLALGAVIAGLFVVGCSDGRTTVKSHSAVAGAVPATATTTTFFCDPAECDGRSPDGVVAHSVLALIRGGETSLIVAVTDVRGDQVDGIVNEVIFDEAEPFGHTTVSVGDVVAVPAGNPPVSNELRPGDRALFVGSVSGSGPVRTIETDDEFYQGRLVGSSGVVLQPGEAPTSLETLRSVAGEMLRPVPATPLTVDVRIMKIGGGAVDATVNGSAPGMLAFFYCPTGKVDTTTNPALITSLCGMATARAREGAAIRPAGTPIQVGLDGPENHRPGLFGSAPPAVDQLDLVVTSAVAGKFSVVGITRLK